ncbi:MAG: ABC transporter ATP-binding protein [Planctomycetes bacterium]|nr:ABC transporter ATP-binding protein [Planctomycetota bacterium]
MNELLHLEGVSKAFGRVQALRSVDLSVGRGEIVGFVGPNGAGKSTCMRICVGIVDRDAGTVRALDRDPRRDPIAIRSHCGYLPGETSLYRNATGHEFLQFAYGGYSVRPEIIDLAPELFDLPLHRRIREYSAGMKQRLALRATLPLDTELFLLDEPDRAIDASARLSLRQVLLALAAEGRGILLSSHHLSEVEAIADRTVFLLEGQRVPTEALRAAREQLRSDVRLRLAREIDLPGGTTLVERLPGGTLRVVTEGDPIAWLSRIPATDIVAAEVGATRLEDLYRVLTERGTEVTP